jgi:hypothetical protein
MPSRPPVRSATAAGGKDASVGLQQLPKDKDDSAKDDEELFSFPERQPGQSKRSKLVLIVVTLVLVGVAVWMLMGWVTDPCQGVPAGAMVEDPDHSGGVILCKG